MTDWNEDKDVALTFKGFFTIFDGGTPFRFKELLELTIITAADSEKYYDDEGEKRKKSLGDSSTFEIRVKKTADLYAVGNAPYSGADLKTISHFKQQIMNDRIIPSATFEGVDETEASSNAFVVENIVCFVENIEDARTQSTGAKEVVISGEVKKHNFAKRQAAAP